MNRNTKFILKYMQLRRIDEKSALTAEEAESLLEGKKVFISSPLHDPDPEQLRRNMLVARNYCNWLGAYCERAWAPHAWLPEFLDDYNRDEREIAVQVCNLLLSKSDLLVACGEKITVGMGAEIALANKLGKPVYCLEAIR